METHHVITLSAHLYHVNGTLAGLDAHVVFREVREGGIFKIDAKVVETALDVGDGNPGGWGAVLRALVQIDRELFPHFGEDFELGLGLQTECGSGK